MRRYDAFGTARRQIWLIQGGPRARRRRGRPGGPLPRRRSDADGVRARTTAAPAVGMARLRRRSRRGPPLQRELLATWGSAVRQFCTQAARIWAPPSTASAGPARRCWSGASRTAPCSSTATPTSSPTGRRPALRLGLPGPRLRSGGVGSNFDRIGQAYLAGCADDRACRAELGDDPSRSCGACWPASARAPAAWASNPLISKHFSRSSSWTRASDRSSWR
ncbi:MAG: hypothetical protein R3F43_32635 [bacterium]